MRQYSGAPADVAAVVRVGVERRQIAALTRHALVVWDEGTETPVQLLSLERSGFHHTRLRASADGNWLSATSEEHLWIWKQVNGVWREYLHEIDPGLCAARFPEPATLVTATLTDGVDWLLTRRTLDSKRSRVGKKIAQFSAFPSSLLFPALLYAGHWWATDLSHDARWVLLSAREKAIHVWNATTGEPVGTVKLRGIPNEAAFSPDGVRFAVDGGTTVYIHDTRTLELVASWRIAHCYRPILAWSPDGRWLARSALCTAVRKYNVAEKREGEALGIPRQRATSVAFSEDGSTYLVGTARGSVIVWDFDE